jgi:4-amino-4-deoxy-L-arabinose transferase-like glycosyltransferase
VQAPGFRKIERMLLSVAVRRLRWQASPAPALPFCALGLALGLVALAYLGQAFNGVIITAAAVLLAGATMRPAGRWRPSALLGALCLSLAATLVVTTLTNGGPLETYWPSFGLWLAGVGLLFVAACWDWLRGLPAAFLPWLRANRAEVGLVAALTAFTAAVRLIHLASIPWPFTGDESLHLMRALEAVDGNTNPFASGQYGHPTAYFLTLGGMARAFGETYFVARLFGVILGTAVTPVLYLMLRRLFNREVAFAGTAYMAAYHLMVHFSRQDMNNAGDALILALVALFLWRSLTSLRTQDYLLTGLIAGLGLYLNVGCRLAVPLILAVCLLTLLLRRETWRRQLQGLGWLTAAFLAAAGPLALWWYEHPGEFSNRINVIGVIQSGWLESESAEMGKGDLTLLWQQVRHAFGGFGYYTDQGPHYHGPRALIDQLTLPFFLLGAAVAVLRLRELRWQILVALFAGVVITGGVLTLSPPNAQRLLGTVPASAAFIGVGLVAIAGAASRLVGRRAYLPLIGAAVVLLAAYNLLYYFGEYADGDYYSDYNTRVAIRAVEFAQKLEPGTQVFWYGAPNIYRGHATLTYGMRDYRFFDVLEDDTIDLAPQIRDGPAAFLFMAHRRDDRNTVMALCPGGELATVTNKDGRVMLWTYVAPPGSDCGLWLKALAPP